VASAGVIVASGRGFVGATDLAQVADDLPSPIVNTAGGAASDPGPTVESSLRKLGLRVQRKPGDGVLFVVDHIDRTPTPN